MNIKLKTIKILRDDGEVFVRGPDGLFRMQSSEMAVPWAYTEDALMSHNTKNRKYFTKITEASHDRSNQPWKLP